MGTTDSLTFKLDAKTEMFEKAENNADDSINKEGTTKLTSCLKRLLRIAD